MYDLICVLGYKFNQYWKLPPYQAAILAQAAELYHSHVANTVVLSGRWSIEFDRNNIKPPTTEAKEMEKMLMSFNVPQEHTVREEYSKDTIGNAYFLKTKIVLPKNLKRLIIVCADFHSNRAQFIFKKIFGSDYRIDFLGVHTDYWRDLDLMQKQNTIFMKQEEFLHNMPEGDHIFLKNKFYNHTYYQ